MRLLAACAALAVLLTACTTDLPRDSAGQVTVAATTDAFSITVGDCVGKVAGDSTDELPIVPCAQEHFWEAYAASELAGTDYPGNAEIKDLAGKTCNAAFTGFIGIASDGSRYEVTYLTPTKQTWTSARDREVVCLVGSSRGGVTGSLKGSGK